MPLSDVMASSPSDAPPISQQHPLGRATNNTVTSSYVSMVQALPGVASNATIKPINIGDPQRQDKEREWLEGVLRRKEEEEARTLCLMGWLQGPPAKLRLLSHASLFKVLRAAPSGSSQCQKADAYNIGGSWRLPCTLR